MVNTDPSLRGMRWSIIVSALLLIIACSQQQASNVHEPEVDHLYITWETLELDRGASAWLIKRFVDPEATFHFVEDGTFPTTGIAFDIPGATFVRTHEQTTYDRITSAYNISDPAVIAIGDVVRALEIGRWQVGDEEELAAIEIEVQQRIDLASNPNQALDSLFAYFDQLYTAKSLVETN